MHNMSREGLISLLDDIRASVASGDSFEGHIRYQVPESDTAALPFDVAAVYRIGNRVGQGGCVVIGTGPLSCPACGDTAGPHDLKTGRCDDCTKAAA